jgi:hypothetical protein
MSDVRYVDAAFVDPARSRVLDTATAMKHAPRILLLYGSNNGRVKRLND